jgi:hypothetical protein
MVQIDVQATLTSWSRDLFETIIAAQAVKKFPTHIISCTRIYFKSEQKQKYP